jgi:hypothetical protein
MYCPVASSQPDYRNMKNIQGWRHLIGSENHSNIL